MLEELREKREEGDKTNKRREEEREVGEEITLHKSMTSRKFDGNDYSLLSSSPLSCLTWIIPLNEPPFFSCIPIVKVNIVFVYLV